MGLQQTKNIFQSTYSPTKNNSNNNNNSSSYSLNVFQRCRQCMYRRRSQKQLSSLTSLSSEEIQKLQETFNKISRNGKLNKTQFIELYSSIRPEPNEKLKKIGEYVFKAFDTNNDDFITFNEFLVGYGLTNRGPIERKLEYTFLLYDADNDGYLVESELKQVLTAMLHLIEASNIDLDIMVGECMNKLDISKSGKISKDEFVRVLSKDYTLRAVMSPFN